MDDIVSDADDRDTANRALDNGTRPHKRVQSKSRRESTRGRNRSDLPQQYNTPSDMRFDDHFLPEIQYLFGLEPDPWSSPTVALVQRARDKVFTEFQHTLTTKSAVFRNVCPRLRSPFILADWELQAKASLSSWRRTLLKKAEKVVENYFTDGDRFLTPADIAHQAQFLLGDGKIIPWLFKNGPNVTSAQDLVRTPSSLSSLPLTRAR